MKNIRTNTLIQCIIGALLIIIVYRLVTCNKPMPEKPKVVAVKEITKTVDNNELFYKQKTDSLVSKQMVLLNQIKSLSVALAIAQSNNKLAAKAAKKVIDLPIPNDSAAIENDYITKDDIINDLVERANTSDSLCNLNIDNLNKQIALKDTTIAAKDLLYTQLRTAFNTTANNQLQLEAYSTQLKKQLRRKKASVFFWKVGTIALAGLLTYQTIK